VKFTRNEKKLFGTLGLVTYLTGVTLYILSHWVRVTTAIGEQHHPAEYWVRVVHNTLTYTIVMSVGYLIKAHVFPGLRPKKKPGLKSGLAILTVILLLILSAIGTMYAGDSQWNYGLAQTHGLIGLGSLLAILLHLAARAKHR
jgi:uncharacterized membrane protein YagU involved in acid resistance